MEGSCGARYPAWPRVCTGHGFEPSSNSTFAKSPGSVASCLISSGVNALRSRVSNAIVPPKCCQFVEGRAGGAISRTGLMLPTSSLPLADFGSVHEESELFSVESRGKQMPSSRREGCGGRKTVVFTNQSSTWPLSRARARKNSSAGSPRPAIMVEAFGRVRRASPKRRGTRENRRAGRNRLLPEACGGRRRRAGKSRCKGRRMGDRW